MVQDSLNRKSEEYHGCTITPTSTLDPDATLRKGFNEFTLEKWQAFLDLKAYFDDMTEIDVYHLIHVKWYWVGLFIDDINDYLTQSWWFQIGFYYD